MPKVLIAAALLAGLISCDQADPSNGVTVGPLPAPHTEIGKAASSICDPPVYCGQTGYLDCASEADGPAYYFRRADGTIISACGGNCMGDPNNICPRMCPPPQWTCGTVYPTSNRIAPPTVTGDR